MSRFVVALVLALCAVSMVSAQVWTTKTDVPAPFGDYGKLDTTHVTSLKNIDPATGKHNYFLVNNLPAQRDETLDTFAALFSPADAVATITITIARPAASGNGLTLVDSFEVTGLSFGVHKNINALGVSLKKGDFLLLSVPDNSVELRVGPNQIGLIVPYAIVALDTTVDIFATPVTASWVLSNGAAAANGDVLQLCISYGTIGNYDHFVPSEYVAVFLKAVGNNPDQDVIRTPGFVSSFEVGLSTISGAIYPTPITVTLWQARLFGGDYVLIDHHVYTGVTGSTPSARVTVPTNSELAVLPGDLIGISLGDATGAGNPIQLNAPAITWQLNNPVQQTTYYAQYQTNNILSTTVTPSTRLPNFHFEVGTKGPSGGDGDPQFAGFQGQNFQFHGLADEHFNLISTPAMQLNAHFVYLSSGKCNFNNTVCFQHPGTYVDVLGFSVPSAQGEIYIRAVAGSHEAGLRVWMGPSTSEMKEVHLHKHSNGIRWAMSNETADVAVLRYNIFGEVTVETPLFIVNVVNSDFFFNMGMTLRSIELLKIGATKHTVTDHQLCDEHVIGKHNGEGHTHALDHAVEQAVAAKYPAAKGLPQVHGLIGQTWRNVKVCSKEWMGGVQDYVVSDLFSEDYVFNYYAPAQ